MPASPDSFLKRLGTLLDEACGHFGRARTGLESSTERLTSWGLAALRPVFEDARREIARGGILVGRAQDEALWNELLQGEEAARAALSAPGRLQLRCLGGFEVLLDGNPVDSWPRRKAQLLLVLLLVYPRGLQVEDLAELLGEGPAGPANIRVYARTIRRAFNPDPDQDERYLVLEAQRYRLAWERVDYLDVKAFETALQEGDRLVASDPAAASRAYEEGLAHYRGNLMEDAGFHQYLQPEREKYRQQALHALSWLAEWEQARGLEVAAESRLRRAAELAPCDEDVWLALAKFHQGRGRPERAREAYWDCRKARKAYLGLGVSEESERAFRELTHG